MIRTLLYSYTTGTLDTVELISVGLADPTCTVETYLCRCTTAPFNKFRCSMDMYCYTIEEAKTDYLLQLEKAIPELQSELDQKQIAIDYCKDEIKRVKAELSV